MDEQNYILEQSIAELDKLLNLSANETDKAACEAIAKKAKIIYEQFPESEEIALRYARILVNLSSKQENVEERLNTANSVKEIFDRFNQSEGIALRYAFALSYLSVEQVNVEERLNTANSVKEIFESFKQSEDIALRYAMALVYMSAKQEIVEELRNTVNSVKEIFELFNQSEDIALQYARALVYMSGKQKSVEERLNTVNAVKEIFDRFNQSEGIAILYAFALGYLSVEQVNVEERLNTVNSVKEIFDRFKQSEVIASLYSIVLFNLSAIQENVEELRNTANSVKEIFELFNQSETIALQYAKALVNLSAKQKNVEKLRNTANSVKEIVDCFNHSEDIALLYVKVLYNLSNLQNDINETNVIVIKILDILKNFSSVEILNILVKILQNNHDIKLDTDKIPTTSLTKILDKLCLNSNIDKDRELLIHALNLKLALNTKYDILNDWIEYYKDVKDKDKLIQLIDIYRIVQEIKFKLGLKEDNKKLQFGHYTKGSTLQVMLEQEEKKEKEKKEKEKKHIFSVSGKTRLYNAGYMNDPEEGLIIEKVLKSNKEGKISSYFKNRNILDPSSWFLMSFTSKTDDLAMWSQYGDDAKGVCLVLREDDFSRFTSFNEVSWRKEGISSVETMNTIESTLSYDLKGSPNESNNIKPTVTIKNEEKRSKSEKKENVPKGNRDYLYRIAYVKNIGEDIGKNIELEQTELFDKYEIEELEKLLNSLKDKLIIDSKVTEENYQDAIAKCIEEIRYLFKSVDYKYENELRILRYANLDPSNDKIKIDKTSGIGKLYVERENPIQIEEVIFGPKFPNPEYVTPLLKLLDKDINYKKSTIKFR